MPEASGFEVSPSQATPAALRVVEFSSGVTGAYCGWLLSRMGAKVVRIGSPAPAAVAPDRNPLALALAYYHDGKVVGEADGDAWLAEADMVITDDVAGLERAAQRSLDDLSARFPQTVFGAASVFGLTGPLAKAPAVSLDAQAISSVAWALGERGRAPLSIPPGILDCQAGAHLAAACLMARFAGGADHGRIADIALADVLASYVAVNCRFYIHHGMEWRRAGRRASNSGGAYPFVILPCLDGDVCLSGRTRPEWERFVEAMGSPEWAKEPRYQRLRAMGQQYPQEVDALILPWLKQHTKAEIEEIANRHQLTIAPLRTFDEVLATPQLADRGFLHPWSYEGRTLLGPGLPFKASEVRSAGKHRDLTPRLLEKPAPAPAKAAARPLAGLRVLDFGWVWSAPQVGSILAQFGAQVIKVEHSKRLDNSRMSGSIVRDGQKVEGVTTDMSPMFHQINMGKLGITLNTKEPAAVELLKRLVATSDIVLENMSAGAMERTGLGYEVLKQINERVIMVAMSGAGQFGPLSDMRTYAPAMSSFAGLESMVGYPGESPVGALNFAIGDPNAAAHALVAIFAALTRRETTKVGCYIDLSQTEALLATLTPFLLLSQVEGRQPPLMGNTHPAMAPHGVYPTLGEDRWLTIAVQDDRQWAALAAMKPKEPWMQDERYARIAGRLELRQELDAALSAWTARQDRDSLVDCLRGAGIPSSPVQDIGEFWADRQYAARAAKHSVELPGLGIEALFRAPWTFSDIVSDTATRGPVLGEHNEAVLKGILGLSSSEYNHLKETGVIS